jgi:hypothetical protein
MTQNFNPPNSNEQSLQPQLVNTDSTDGLSYLEDRELVELKADMYSTQGEDGISEHVEFIKAFKRLESEGDILRNELKQAISLSKDKSITQSAKKRYEEKIQRIRSEILEIKKELGESTWSDITAHSLQSLRSTIGGKISIITSSALDKLKGVKATTMKQIFVDFALVGGLVFVTPKVINFVSPPISTVVNETTKKFNEIRAEADNEKKIKEILGHSVYFKKQGEGWNNNIPIVLEEYARIKSPTGELDFPPDFFDDGGWTGSYNELSNQFKSTDERIAEYNMKYPKGFKRTEVESKNFINSLLGNVDLNNEGIEKALDKYIKLKYPNINLDLPDKISSGYREVNTFVKLREAIKEIDIRIEKFKETYPQGYKIAQSRYKIEIEQVLGHPLTFTKSYNYGMRYELKDYFSKKYPSLVKYLPDGGFDQSSGWVDSYGEFKLIIDRAADRLGKK